MSLTSPARTPFRPEDKALDLLFPSSEDPLTDSISQYINGDLVDHSEDDKDVHFLGDLVDLFDKTPYPNGSSCLSSIGGSARHTQPSPQPWRKGLWCLNETSGPDGASDQHCTSSQAPKKDLPVSNVGVVGLGLIEQPCSLGPVGQTPPPSRSSSPLHLGTKKSCASPRSASIRRNPYAPLDPDRRQSLSPHLGQSVRQNSTGMAYNELFHREFQSFGIGPRDENDPISPPNSGRPVQPADMSTVIQHQTTAGVGVYSPRSHYAQQPYDLGSHGYNAQGFSIPQTAMTMSQNDQLSDQSQSQLQPIPSWTTDTYDSSYGTDLSYDLPNMPEVGEGQGWWSPPHSLTTIKCEHLPQQQELYPQFAAPIPHPPTHSLVQHPPSLQTSSLPAQYQYSNRTQRQHSRHHHPQPLYDHSSPGVLSETTLSPGVLSDTTLSPGTITSSFSPARSFPFPQTHFIKKNQYPTTPLRTCNLPSPTRSPSASPTRTVRARARARHPSSTTSTNTTTTDHVTKTSRRKPSSSSISKRGAPRHGGTHSSSSTARQAEDGFLNFTAQDADEINGGVATSGSTNTRRRREAEQREKQRLEHEKALRKGIDIGRQGKGIGDGNKCSRCFVDFEEVGGRFRVVGEGRKVCENCFELAGEGEGKVGEIGVKEEDTEDRDEVKREETGAWRVKRETADWYE